MIKVSSRNLVVQHNRIIEAKYRLSVGEQRLVKLLISMIEKDDEDFKVYKVSVADFSRLLDVSDKDIYRKVKNSSKKLISNVLTFIGEDDRELQVAWLSSAEYIPNEGVVELEFSPKLKPFLLQLKKHFTAYELGNVINLKHTYSIRIYELLKQYEKIGIRSFKIEHLRELLMLKDNEYKQFCDFRRWILKPAQKELNEKTDIYFLWNEEKKNQKCVSIEFIIYTQDRSINSNDISNDETDNVVVDIDKKMESNSIKLSENSLKLIELGISHEVAKNLSETYETEKITAAINYTESLKLEGKIQNPAGFLVDAIRKGFRDNQAEEREKKEKAIIEANAREEHAKKFEQLKSSYSGAINSMFEMWYSSLSEDALAEHRNQFMKTLNPMFKKHKTIVEKTFTAHLKTLMPFPSLREWAKQSQVDISKFENELAKEERQAVTAIIAENSEIAA